MSKIWFAQTIIRAMTTVIFSQSMIVLHKQIITILLNKQTTTILLKKLIILIPNKLIIALHIQ